jgi:hypothetical protein
LAADVGDVAAPVHDRSGIRAAGWWSQRPHRGNRDDPPSFAGPEGFAWEVAWNPGFHILDDGSIRLPG